MSDVGGADDFDPSAFGVGMDGENANNNSGQGTPDAQSGVSGDNSGSDSTESVALEGRVSHRPGEHPRAGEFAQNDAQFLSSISEALERGEIGLDGVDGLVQKPSEKILEEIEGLAGNGSPAGDGDGGGSGQPQPPTPSTVSDVTYPPATPPPSTPTVPSPTGAPTAPPVVGGVNIEELAQRVTGSEVEAQELMALWRNRNNPPQPQPQYYPQQVPQPYQQYQQPQPQPQPQQQVVNPDLIPANVDPDLYKAIAPVMNAALQQQMAPIQQQVANQQQYLLQQEAQRQQEQVARNNAEIERARTEFRDKYQGLTATDYAVIEQKLVQSNSLQGFLASNPSDIHGGTTQALDYFALSDPTIRQKIMQAQIDAERQQQFAEQQKQNRSTAISGGSGRVPGQGGTQPSSTNTSNGRDTALTNALAHFMNN